MPRLSLRNCPCRNGLRPDRVAPRRSAHDVSRRLQATRGSLDAANDNGWVGVLRPKADGAWQRIHRKSLLAGSKIKGQISPMGAPRRPEEQFPAVVRTSQQNHKVARIGRLQATHDRMVSDQRKQAPHGGQCGFAVLPEVDQTKVSFGVAWTLEGIPPFVPDGD